MSEGLGCNAQAVARERPVLFSAPMVRALLAGTKTQTRRVVKGAPDGWNPVGPEWFAPTVVDRHGDEQPGADVYGAGNEDGTDWRRCPYGAPSGRLWVRETWAAPHAYDGHQPAHIPALTRWHYAATEDRGGLRWRPSIHMPRVACRLVLTLKSVRVERLNEISRGDAMAEDCPLPNMADGADPRQWYADLWDEINGPGSWSANPWVWALTFHCGPNLQPNGAVNGGL